MHLEYSVIFYPKQCVLGNNECLLVGDANITLVNCTMLVVFNKHYYVEANLRKPSNLMTM